MGRTSGPKDGAIRRGNAVGALVNAARAILESRSLADGPGAIGRACKATLGAEAGFVTVGSPGRSARVDWSDAGPDGITVGTCLPAPLRALGLRATRSGRPVLSDALSPGAWKKILPPGRSAPKNALLAPLRIGGRAGGLLVLLGKPGGFSQADARLAVVFAGLAATAYAHKRAAALLGESQRALELELREQTTELRQARDAAQRARHTAIVLREATVALTRSVDRDTVLAALLDHLRRLVPFDRARVMVLEEASRVSVRAVFDGHQAVPLSPGQRPQFEAGDDPLVNGILKSGTAVLVPDSLVHPDWSLGGELSGEASWMGVPLFARGDVAGLLALAKREAGAFTEEHVRLAEALAAQASVAVENSILFDRMQAATVHSQSLARRLVEAHETERTAIARELHDEASQALVALRLGLGLLEKEMDDRGRIAARVAELRRTTDGVLESLHRLAADLRPASLDHLGLEVALRQFVRSIGAKFGLAIRFKARGLKGDRLPAVVETALFRVAQEAVTNVVRHAGASRIDVLVERRGDRVVVVVEDDGVGFDPKGAPNGKHFGLVGMRERAEALGGALAIESATGKGATVVVEVICADPNPDR